MATLTSTGTFTVTSVDTVTTTITDVVLPSVGFPTGFGRLVHPTLGTFDYDVKPDEWVNIDGDVLIAPVWASVKTLGGASTSMWTGSIEDVICEEKWGLSGNLAMPIAMLRMLLSFWSTPIDPAVGYVQWFPNYVSNNGYNVIINDLVVGSGGGSQMAKVSGIGYQTIALDDLIHSINPDGSPNGWVRNQVTMFLKMVSKVG